MFARGGESARSGLGHCEGPEGPRVLTLQEPLAADSASALAPEQGPVGAGEGGTCGSQRQGRAPWSEPGLEGAARVGTRQAAGRTPFYAC